MRRIFIPRKYYIFATSYLICASYSIIFSGWMGPQTLSYFSDFLEGDTYYTRPTNAWLTSIVAQFIFLCLLPPFFCSISKIAQVFAIRLYLFFNAYFACIQVLTVFDVSLLQLLPIHIGVNTADGFNLSFGRAVGLTSAHGAFYFSFGMLSAALILLVLNSFRWFDAVLAMFATLSLSRSAIVIALIFLLLIAIRQHLRAWVYMVMAVFVVFSGMALLNSSLWELRLLYDKSGEVRGGQISAAIQSLVENPMGIGAQHPYFFDGSLTAIMVEYGIIGIIGQVVICFTAFRALKPSFGNLQTILILTMGVMALALTGSPFAYLPTLFIGMLIYISSAVNSKVIK